jgi:hypothetical protein
VDHLLGAGHDQARCLKDLERNKIQVKTVVAGLTLDKPILKEAVEGNY